MGEKKMMSLEDRILRTNLGVVEKHLHDNSEYSLAYYVRQALTRLEKQVIVIDDDVKEYLDKVLNDDGAEAWYTEQIRLDLKDYNGAIKALANKITFERMVRISNDGKKIDFDFPFKTSIRILKDRQT